jgi:hypothetical protein
MYLSIYGEFLHIVIVVLLFCFDGQVCELANVLITAFQILEPPDDVPLQSDGWVWLAVVS